MADEARFPTAGRHRGWTYVRVLAVPLALWGLVLGFLWEPIQEWLALSRIHDETILREWIEESRDSLQRNLRVTVEHYLDRIDEARQLRPDRNPADDPTLLVPRDRIREFLEVLGTPPTKMYSSTLPLFPIVQRIDICFPRGDAEPITWHSLLPGEGRDYESFEYALGSRSSVKLRYQFHAYDKRQRELALRATRVRQLGVLAIIATGLSVAWVVFVQRREQAQDQQRRLAQAQVDQAERLLLQEELRRQEAEHRHQEAERDLLEQKLAAQQYEQKMLEMKAQLFANIGIMAGSYAHNIKNLLVRPNDLLRRCLEAQDVSPEQTHRLQEVQHTLGTVTERLQQILETVRRDPSRSDQSRLDLREILRNLEQTWKELARERWKMHLSVEVPAEPLWIEGDISHIQQAIENLLFNARDATFQMRNHLRDQARKAAGSEAQKKAVLEAMAWKGQVSVRAWRDADRIWLEVRDNGIGMSEDVRQRCTETYFSTKRDNALFEGHSTGMGLGLSFVQMVLDNHKARLEILSTALEGASFRICFPAAEQN